MNVGGGGGGDGAAAGNAGDRPGPCFWTGASYEVVEEVRETETRLWRDGKVANDRGSEGAYLIDEGGEGKS